MTDETKNKMIGNKFWKLRSKHGADPKFSDPDKLRLACEDYFDWVIDNPLTEEKVGFYEGDPCRTDISIMRAMTIEALSVFIGIKPSTWFHWRKNREDLSDIIAWADSVMRSYNIEGASGNMLNHNIIARYHGLNDIRAHQQLDADGETTDPVSAVTVNMCDISKSVHEELMKLKKDQDEKDA